MKIEELKELAKELQNKGWSEIKFRTKIKESSGTFDILAVSKGVLKKSMLIIVSSDIYDAQIALMLLNGVPKKYSKIVFLESGDPAFVEKADDVKIVTRTEQIPGV